MKKLSEDFWTDGVAIFYQNYGKGGPKSIPNVDTESFEIKSNVFACDKNKIYAISTMREGLQIFEPVDRESVVFITTRYFADKYNLYFYNSHFIEYCHLNNHPEIKKALQRKHPNVDSWWNHNNTLYKSFNHVKHNIYYFQDKLFYLFKESKLLYDYPTYRTEVSAFNFSSLEACFLELPVADNKTFEVINKVYLKDTKQIYFYSRPIQADVKTFKVLEDLFAKDKNGIWYNGRLAKVEDIESFEIISKNLESKEFHFSKDKFNVYSNITTRIKFGSYAKILTMHKNSDPSTFHEINDVWAKDRNNVYWFGKIYKKADAETFEKISEKPITEFEYARDKNHVYIANGITLKKGLHGGSFKILNEFWAKDDFVVYSLYTERIQKNIDVNTFRILDENGKAEDANFIFEIKELSIKKSKKLPPTPVE